VTAGGPRYERYGPDREWMMRLGPAGPAILFVPPLFEEMNRTRAFLAAVMRRLAERGLGTILPDLPGTGESVRELACASWQSWREAVAGLAEGAIATVAVRGGCLLDDAAARPAWRLAPTEGASLVRDLERSGMVSGGGAAGYSPSPDLLEALRNARPAAAAALRTVRLASDRGDADLKVEGPPLWRRSEPQTSNELSSLIASDIIQWVQTCAAC
jgi:pimeloyl-ACP methyl ester carboxylesterase